MSQLMFLTAGDQTDVQGETDTEADVSDKSQQSCASRKGFQFVCLFLFSIRIILIKSFMGVCTENHVSV